MAARSFFDSNVLVYTDDHGAPRKQKTALELIEGARLAGTGALSTQVLEEYFTAATRKLAVPATLARRKVELFARLDIMLIDLDDILAAIDLHRLHQLSFWDALIVRSAQQSGCSVLYTEDLQHSSTIQGIDVVNPFLR